MDNILTNKDLKPTENQDRTWSKWNITALWIGMSISIPTYTLASSMIDQGWSWQATITSITMGNIIVLIPMLLNAHPGTKYGIPFPVLLRSSFGIFGANIPALIRALVACGWFGIQTWIGGSATYKILIHILPHEITKYDYITYLNITTLELLCFLCFWTLQLIIINFGMKSIKIVENIAAPLLILMGLSLFILTWYYIGNIKIIITNLSPVTKNFSSAIWGAGLTCGVGFWGTLALNIPDFSRYAKSQKEQIIGQIIGLVPTMTTFAFIGAMITNATIFIFGSRISDPIIVLNKMTNNSFISIITMICIMIATLTTNLAANVVSPANDFSNLNPKKISFKTGAFITSILGILIMPWNIYNNTSQYLFTWLVGCGAMLGAIGGIMIADYFILKKCKLNIPQLYKQESIYKYKHGFNIKAMLSLILGISVSIPGFLSALNIIHTHAIFHAIYERAWFVGFFISGISFIIFNYNKNNH